MTDSVLYRIMMKNNKVHFIIFFFFFSIFLAVPVLAQESNFSCLIYFTGVGCPHCANTDPIILEQLPKKYPNLVVIEYEIYQNKVNAPLIYLYNEKYESGLGIPLIISENKNIGGDRTILKEIKKIVEKSNSRCVLLDRLSNFEDLDINVLLGNPKIWKGERILIKTGQGIMSSRILRGLLLRDEISKVLEENEIEYRLIEPKSVALSGKDVSFENAIQIENWIFQWNGPPISGHIAINETESISKDFNTSSQQAKFTLPKIVSLAVVDAINPCALAVLVLILTAILAYNPENRSKVLLAGLSFVISVFVMYFLYGLIIIKFFQAVQALTMAKLWLYKILGGIAIILGILNIRDFIKYKPGRIGTEMPLVLRPKVKKMISGITSPKGAFGVGIFVTLFLLPCTIGPYIICGGILCPLGLLKTFPWLLLYNLIFVLPMLIIVGLIYFGLGRVENISEWKERNIKYLHLIAGLIMTGLGIVMILGLT